ncbi:MAG: general secretion pathway protein J [Desulforhopalus sp.]|jgi:general secretion pathway protein J
MNSSTRKGAGFTLIELLFAIFIFSIVISSVYGAYRATFHIIAGSEKHLNESHKARAAMERITEDLTAIVTGPGGLLHGVEQEVSGGRGDNISFLSSTHIALREDETLRGDALIQYSSVEDEEGELINLMRADSVKRPGTTSETNDDTTFLLCAGLKEVRFTYFNKEGEEATEWQAESQVLEDGTVVSPDLPVMVSIELIFPGQDSSTNGSVFKTAVALSRIIED